MKKPVTVGELLRWVHDSLECLVGLGVSRVAFTDHHEPDMGLLKEVFQELGSKSRQSVPMYAMIRVSESTQQ